MLVFRQHGLNLQSGDSTSALQHRPSRCCSPHHDQSETIQTSQLFLHARRTHPTKTRCHRCIPGTTSVVELPEGMATSLRMAAYRNPPQFRRTYIMVSLRLLRRASLCHSWCGAGSRNAHCRAGGWVPCLALRNVLHSHVSWLVFKTPKQQSFHDIERSSQYGVPQVVVQQCEVQRGADGEQTYCVARWTRELWEDSCKGSPLIESAEALESYYTIE